MAKNNPDLIHPGCCFEECKIQVQRTAYRSALYEGLNLKTSAHRYIAGRCNKNGDRLNAYPRNYFTIIRCHGWFFRKKLFFIGSPSARKSSFASDILHPRAYQSTCLLYNYDRPAYRRNHGRTGRKQWLGSSLLRWLFWPP